MNVASLVTVSQNEYAIQGSLDNETVPALWKQLESTIKSIKSNALTLDLFSVENIDTAGVACLVNGCIYCNKKQITMTLKNVPDSIYKLAKISDVDGILGLQ